MKNNFKKFVLENKIDAEILTYDKAIGTVKEAVEELKINKKQLIKTILLISHNGNGLLVLIRGNDKVDLKKVAQELKYKRVRLATSTEVKKLTGYNVGEVPPIGISSLPTLIDQKILKLNIVYGGGGSKNSILKIKPNQILIFANAKVCNISR